MSLTMVSSEPLGNTEQNTFFSFRWFRWFWHLLFFYSLNQKKLKSSPSLLLKCLWSGHKLHGWTMTENLWFWQIPSKLYQRLFRKSQEKVECLKQNEEKGPKNIFHLCFSLSFSHLNINFYFFSLSGCFVPRCIMWSNKIQKTW